MKVVCASDFHGMLPEIPECDLLLISGDICPHAGKIVVEVFGQKRTIRVNVGSQDDIFFQMKWLIGPFKEWLDKVPAKEVVACWGNHDFIGQKSPEMVPQQSLRWHMLTDEGWEYEGKKIWGTPWQPWFYDWAFNSPGRGGDPEGERFLSAKWAMIPEDTDILLVHGPPFGYGDLTLEGDQTGSTSLLDRIKVVKPTLVVSGHIHEGYGTREVETGIDGRTIICNASVLDRNYEMVHQPVVFEL